MKLEPLQVAAVLILAVVVRSEPVPLLDIKDVPVLENPDQRLNVLVITRYGTTYPLEGTTLKGDKFPGFSSKTLQLTDKGHEMMEHVGKLLMKRYQNHFNHLAEAQKQAPDIIKVTATDKKVAKESAQDIINGMKKQDPKLAKRIKMELSAENIEENEWVTFPDQTHKGTCDYFDNLVKTTLPSPGNEVAELDLQPACFIFGVRTMEDVYKQYNRLQMERLNGIELPDWTKEDGTTLIQEAMKKVVKKRMETAIGGSIKYWKFFVSSVLLNVFKEFNIVDGLPSTAERNAQKPRIHLHVVDDYVMYALVWWFRLEEEISDGFSNGLANYYSQAGDSLILEFDSNQNARAFYLRSAEESIFKPGLKSLSLSPKAKVIGSKVGSKGPEVGQSGSLPAHWLYMDLFQSYRELEHCCKTGKLC